MEHAAATGGCVTLYTTHCPKCRVLEIKLRQKNIPYTTVTDINKIIATGRKTAPILEVGGIFMEFGEALEWVKNHEN